MKKYLFILAGFLFITLFVNINKAGEWGFQYDLNNDGVVDGKDLAMFADSWLYGGCANFQNFSVLANEWEKGVRITFEGCGTNLDGTYLLHPLPDNPGLWGYHEDYMDDFGMFILLIGIDPDTGYSSLYAGIQRCLECPEETFGKCTNELYPCNFTNDPNYGVGTATIEREE
jgi:hypothetical protein